MNVPSAMIQPMVVLQTPPGRGAVATISVQGPAAALVVDRFFRPLARGRMLGEFEIGRILFGRWGTDAGEDIVACRTASNEFEIHCHGGRVAADRIQRDLVAAGCEIIDWQRWRDLQNRRRTRDEAAQALAQARTVRTAAILLDQHQGAWQAEITHLLGLVAHAAFDDVGQRLAEHLQWADFGIHLTEPWRVVLAGRPNVGKSSLINAIVGYQRAIVFNQPGTTRDIVTAQAAIDGWPVEISDTAGLHAAADPLEAAGIERSKQQIASADWLVLVFDASAAWLQEDERLLADYPQAIVVHNKADCRLDTKRPAGLFTCATTGTGVECLLDRLADTMVPAVPEPGRAVPFTRRQIQLIRAAEQAVLSRDAQGVELALARLDATDDPAER